MSEGVSNESAQQAVNERLPSDQNYTERFVQALALDLLDARARVKELEAELRSWQDRAYEIQETINERDDRIAELEDWITSCAWYQPKSNSSPSCPFCTMFKHWGHSTACIVRAIAARAAGEDK